MNKMGHLLVTSQLPGRLRRRHQACLMLGSILPDLVVTTYCCGHTWDARSEKTMRAIRRLSEKGRQNCVSYLRLGYTLHYVEDYFTLPHNAWYGGSLSEHVAYERGFQRYLKSRRAAALSGAQALTAGSLTESLRRMHERYEAEDSGFATDFRYIHQAAQQMECSFFLIFQRNQQAAIAVRRMGEHSFIYSYLPFTRAVHRS